VSLADPGHRPAAFSALVEAWGHGARDAAAALVERCAPGSLRAWVVDEALPLAVPYAPPSGEPTPGVRMLTLCRRRPGIARERFARAWREEHTRVALSFTVAPRGYGQDVVVENLVAPGDDDVDGIASFYFESYAEFEARYTGHPEEAARGAADAARFMDLARCESAFAIETVHRSRPRDRDLDLEGTMSDQGITSLLSGQAWAEFCESLRKAGDIVLRDASPREPLDVAEGYRYIARIVRLALEQQLENSDPLQPRIQRGLNETIKLGCDNPDQQPLLAAIDGRHEYRIRGQRGSVAYLSFGTYLGGDYGRSGRSGCSGSLDANALAVDAQGCFEIVLSQKPHAGNWLPMEPETNQLIVRQTRLRPTERLAELAIERIGAAEAPRPLDAAEFQARLAAAARYVAGSVNVFTDWTEAFAAHPNQLRPLSEAVKLGAHGDPRIHYLMGYWTLAPDEALLIETTPPRCDYWNFQLNNYWLESLDYRYHHIAVNAATAHTEPDGSVRIVVAHADPGLPNWIETAGHRHGTMAVRWINAQEHPRPTCRVLRFDALARA
jgi:hypothetical protein